MRQRSLLAQMLWSLSFLALDLQLPSFVSCVPASLPVSYPSFCNDSFPAEPRLFECQRLFSRMSSKTRPEVQPKPEHLRSAAPQNMRTPQNLHLVPVLDSRGQALSGTFIRTGSGLVVNGPPDSDGQNPNGPSSSPHSKNQNGERSYARAVRNSQPTSSAAGASSSKVWSGGSGSTAATDDESADAGSSETNRDGARKQRKEPAEEKRLTEVNPLRNDDDTCEVNSDNGHEVNSDNGDEVNSDNGDEVNSDNGHESVETPPTPPKLRRRPGDVTAYTRRAHPVPDVPLSTNPKTESEEDVKPSKEELDRLMKISADRSAKKKKGRMSEADRLLCMDFGPKEGGRLEDVTWPSERRRRTTLPVKTESPAAESVPRKVQPHRAAASKKKPEDDDEQEQIDDEDEDYIPPNGEVETTSEASASQHRSRELNQQNNSLPHRRLSARVSNTPPRRSNRLKSITPAPSNRSSTPSVPRITVDEASSVKPPAKTPSSIKNVKPVPEKSLNTSATATKTASGYETPKTTRPANAPVGQGSSSSIAPSAPSSSNQTSMRKSLVPDPAKKNVVVKAPVATPPAAQASAVRAPPVRAPVSASAVLAAAAKTAAAAQAAAAARAAAAQAAAAARAAAAQADAAARTDPKVKPAAAQAAAAAAQAAAAARADAAARTDLKVKPAAAVNTGAARAAPAEQVPAANDPAAKAPAAKDPPARAPAAKNPEAQTSYAETPPKKSLLNQTPATKTSAKYTLVSQAQKTVKTNNQSSSTQSSTTTSQTQVSAESQRSGEVRKSNGSDTSSSSSGIVIRVDRPAKALKPRPSMIGKPPTLKAVVHLPPELEEDDIDDLEEEETANSDVAVAGDSTTPNTRRVSSESQSQSASNEARGRVVKCKMFDIPSPARNAGSSTSQLPAVTDSVPKDTAVSSSTPQPSLSPVNDNGPAALPMEVDHEADDEGPISPPQLQAEAPVEEQVKEDRPQPPRQVIRGGYLQQNLMQISRAPQGLSTVRQTGAYSKTPRTIRSIPSSFLGTEEDLQRVIAANPNIDPYRTTVVDLLTGGGRNQIFASDRGNGPGWAPQANAAGHTAQAHAVHPASQPPAQYTGNYGDASAPSSNRSSYRGAPRHPNGPTTSTHHIVIQQLSPGTGQTVRPPVAPRPTNSRQPYNQPSTSRAPQRRHNPRDAQSIVQDMMQSKTYKVQVADNLDRGRPQREYTLNGYVDNGPPRKKAKVDAVRPAAVTEQANTFNTMPAQAVNDMPAPAVAPVPVPVPVASPAASPAASSEAAPAATPASTPAYTERQPKRERIDSSDQVQIIGVVPAPAVVAPMAEQHAMVNAPVLFERRDAIAAPHPADPTAAQPRPFAEAPPVRPALHPVEGGTVVVPPGRSLDYTRWTCDDVAEWAQAFLNPNNSSVTLDKIRNDDLDGMVLNQMVHFPHMRAELSIINGHYFRMVMNAKALDNALKEHTYQQALREYNERLAQRIN